MTNLLKKEIKEKLKQRASVYYGVLERKEVAETTCPVCKEKFPNYQYTRGMITAFNQMIDVINDYD